jgi:flagellar secretion chaperone FliS
MSRRPKALAAYGRVANADTNPIQQIVMLYDGAIKFLHLSAADIESGDLVAKAEHTNRVLDIISYLHSILDFEQGGEVAPALNLLYLSISIETLRASAQLDSALMRRVADLLSPVRDSWMNNAKASAPQATISGLAPIAEPIPA